MSQCCFLDKHAVSEFDEIRFEQTEVDPIKR